MGYLESDVMSLAVHQGSRIRHYRCHSGVNYDNVCPEGEMGWAGESQHFYCKSYGVDGGRSQVRKSLWPKIVIVIIECSVWEMRKSRAEWRWGWGFCG